MGLSYRSRTSSLALCSAAAYIVFLACNSGNWEGHYIGECIDGADNDADGLVDCLDPDCMGSPDCSAGPDDDDSAGDDDDSGSDDDDSGSGDDDSGSGDDDTSAALEAICSQFSPTGDGTEGNDTCHKFTEGIHCPECYDDIDNDGDGGADCADPEAATPSGGNYNNCGVVRLCDGDPSTDCPQSAGWLP